jgi:hypothetical protein
LREYNKSQKTKTQNIIRKPSKIVKEEMMINNLKK